MIHLIRYLLPGLALADVARPVPGAAVVGRSESGATCATFGQVSTTNPKQLIITNTPGSNYVEMQGIQQNVGYNQDVWLQRQGGGVKIGSTSTETVLTANTSTAVVAVFETGYTGASPLVKIIGKNADTTPSFGSTLGMFAQNKNTTSGNYWSIENYDAAGTINASMGFLNVDHTTPKGAWYVVTRNGGAYGVRLKVDESGNVGIGMNPTTQLELSTGGAQKSTGTTWSNPSDERLKTVLGPADLTRCYSDIQALPLIRYRLKDDCFTHAQADDRTLTGFTAQSVAPIMPKAVRVAPFTKPVRADAPEGTLPEVIADCLNLDLSQVQMQLIGAVQHLMAKVATLEARVAQLEA